MIKENHNKENHNEEIRINGKCFDLEVKRDERISAWRWKLSQMGNTVKRDGIATKLGMALQNGRSAAFNMA